MSNQEDDVEAALLETFEGVRWGFIRKVYVILTLHLLTTAAVAAVVGAVPSISLFFSTTWAGLAVYISIVVLLLIVTCFLAACQSMYPYNFIMLGIFTLCFGLVFGLASSFINDPVILVAAIATAVVVVSQTVYTFWEAKRGEGLGFLVPLSIAVVIIVVEFTVLQIYFPMRRFSDMMYSGVAVLVFSAYIIFYVRTLNISVLLYSFDPYIWASVTLYLDVFSIFVSFVLRIFGTCIVLGIMVRALFCPPVSAFTPNGDATAAPQVRTHDTATTLE